MFSLTYLEINSADTPDGDVLNDTHNPVFYKDHTVVKTEGMSSAEFNALKQIQSTVAGYINGSFVNADIKQAEYQEAYSTAYITLGKGTISTQEEKINEKIEIHAIYDSSKNEKGWVRPILLFWSW